MDKDQHKSQYPATIDIPSFVKEGIKHKAKQPGQKKHHKGYARHIPERIDNVKSLIPDECPHCGTELGDTQ